MTSTTNTLQFFSPSQPTTSSTSLSRCLIRHTLRPHFALDPPWLPPRRACRTLRLLGFLLALRRRLLLLALRDSLFACCLTCLGALRAAVFNEFEGRADDASLLLYGAAGALFRGFLEVSRVVSGLKNEGRRAGKEKEGCRWRLDGRLGDTMA